MLCWNAILYEKEMIGFENIKVVVKDVDDDKWVKKVVLSRTLIRMLQRMSEIFF